MARTIADGSDSGSPPSGHFDNLYRWSADAWKEHIFFGFCDDQGNVRSARVSDLSSKWNGNLSTGWAYHTIRTGIKEVNVGFYPSGRLYLTYSDLSNTATATGIVYFKVSPDFGDSWETEQTSTGYATSGSVPAEQPYQAWYSASTSRYNYVQSHSNKLGKDYFVRGHANSRLYNVNDRLYQVTVSGSTVLQEFQAGSNDELGAAWTWVNNANRDGNQYFGNHNGWADYRDWYQTSGPSYISSGVYWSPDARVGLLEQEIMRDAIVASPPVRLSNGTYARLIWSNKQRKIRYASPDQIFTLENTYTAPTMPFTRNFNLDIPTSTIDAEKVTFYYSHEYSTRAIPTGIAQSSDNVSSSADLPTVVDFTIQSWINWSDPTLSGSAWPYVSFRYKNAKRLQLRLGSGTGNQGLTSPVDGIGKYEWFTITVLGASDYALFSGHTSASLPYTIAAGSADEIEIFYTTVRIQGTYALPSETWAVRNQASPTHISYAFPSTFQNVSTGNKQMPLTLDTGTYATTLLTDMNAAKGTMMGLTTVIDKDPAVTNAWPLLINVAEHFAVFQYQQTNADFYLLRSNDGKTWEYSNDAAPVSHTLLNNLRTWNRTGGNTVMCPTLVVLGDILLMAWLEDGKITCLGTNDCGATYSA